ncbi:MAG TPA: class I tRNA ligase family protein, partial [Pseudobdellovibrionaceae bacterium]|nr:class I tRNA ligase family protein [Pseudobdellovibrionaceae bacterium]
QRHAEPRPARQDLVVPPEGVHALPKKVDLSVYDQWILYKLQLTTQKVDESLAADRYADAAMALYHFVWNEFCDWYIEFSKPILSGAASAERSASQLVIAQVLNRICRLLHPFTPFITEEIYDRLPIKGQLCATDEYPTVKSEKSLFALGSAQAAQEVDLVKEVIAAIRNIRGENRISPAQKINVRLGIKQDLAQKILGANRSAILSLGRIEHLEIGDSGDLMKCALSVVAQGELLVDVIVPLEGLVDFAEEIKRINKNIEKLQKDIATLNAKLTNPKFLENADEELIEQDRSLMESSKLQMRALQEALLRFQ